MKSSFRATARCGRGSVPLVPTPAPSGDCKGAAAFKNSSLTVAAECWWKEGILVRSAILPTELRPERSFRYAASPQYPVRGS